MRMVRMAILGLMALLTGTGIVSGQVLNRALSFGKTGIVECGVIDDLKGNDSYSLQFQVNPAVWKEGASLISLGKNFSVKLGKPGEIIFTSGKSKLKAISPDLSAEKWNQITLICNKGAARVLFNGKEVARGKLNGLPKSGSALTLGGNYSGLLDEIRLWDSALNDDMKKFDYFTGNTLNKWCPMWKNLVVYYKMDQELEGRIVDYKELIDLTDGNKKDSAGRKDGKANGKLIKGEKGFALEYPEGSANNHGLMKGDVKRVEAQNDKMPYLINGAYIQTDRALNWYIPADQYLLSNELLILGADALSDGHIVEKTPNNHGDLPKIYEGRGGIKVFMCIQGTYRVREKFGDWREILGDKEKHRIFAEDLAALSKDYDGVELDLEWIEEPVQWEQFGQLAQEIRKRLPAEKEFRISLHNNYSDFPAEDMEVVDGFTFQQYGPNPKNFSYANYLQNVEKFMKRYEKEKILTSYSTTTSRGEGGSPVLMIRFDVLNDYSENDKDVDIYNNEKDTWSYMGPMQVYKRAKHTRENNLAGIFYWDIAGDNREGSASDNEEESLEGFNQAKYCSYGINANNEVIIERISD